MAQEQHSMYFGVWSTEAFYISELGHEEWQLCKARGVARSIVDSEGAMWWRVKIEHF